MPFVKPSDKPTAIGRCELLDILFRRAVNRSVIPGLKCCLDVHRALKVHPPTEMVVQIVDVMEFWLIELADVYTDLNPILNYVPNPTAGV